AAPVRPHRSLLQLFGPPLGARLVGRGQARLQRSALGHLHPGVRPERGHAAEPRAPALPAGGGDMVSARGVGSAATAVPRGVKALTLLPGSGYGDAGALYVRGLHRRGIPVSWTPIAPAPG